MDFISPESRGQVSFGSLDELVSIDNQVRFPDAFVEEGLPIKMESPEAKLQEAFMVFNKMDSIKCVKSDDKFLDEYPAIKFCHLEIELS